MTDDRIVRSACQACHCECGVFVHVKDGKVVKIEGDPEHPMNEGAMCVKGLAYTQLLYHPDRLKYPLKRAGAKGEGKWQRISWDEALDTIANKFKEIIDTDGPRAIAYVAQDGPRTYLTPYFLLLRAMGSPNAFGAEYNCIVPTMQANVTTVGSFITNERGPDFDNADCMLVWGANPVDTHPQLARRILRAKQRGAKLIVVDPRFTNLASKADIWLQVRPGTDDALALGMLNVIINNDLYDKEFVDQWCYGFEELRKRVQEYPVSRVSEITWIPQEQIIAAAKMYATVKPSCLYMRVAVEQTSNSFQLCRALTILIPVTGNLDVKGGNIFTVYPKDYKQDGWLFRRGIAQLPQEVQEQQIGSDQYPYFLQNEVYTPTYLALKSLVHGEPYRIMAVYGVANLVVVTEKSREVMEALKKLEFSVFVDFFMTPTTELADIVLPPATWLEVDDFCDYSYTNYFSVRQKAIEPLYECKDEKWIAIELAKRMGVLDNFITQAKTVEEFLDFRVKDMGLTFNDLREKMVFTEPMRYKKYEQRKFHTPTGKVELYSPTLEKYGIDPLPYYEEPCHSPISTPEVAKEYPLISVFGRRLLPFYHTANRQIPWLREIHPEPTVEIHPKTGEELGIKDGDWVWIETPYMEGRVKEKAVLTTRVHPKVISAEPFWWFPEREGPEYGCFESNINTVASYDLPRDPVVGSTQIRGSLCKIYKVEG